MRRRPCGRRMRGAEQARLRADRPVRATTGASALRAEVPCAARGPRAAPPLALAWPARCSRSVPMLGARHARRRDALGRVAMPFGPLALQAALGLAAQPLARRKQSTGLFASGLACSAPSKRAPACPPTALLAPPWHASSNTTSLAARRAVPGAGDLWRGEKRSSARGSPTPQAADRRGRREVRSAFSAADGGTAAALAMRASQRSRPARPTATVGARPGHRPTRRADVSREWRRIGINTAPAARPTAAARAGPCRRRRGSPACWPPTPPARWPGARAARASARRASRRR